MKSTKKIKLCSNCNEVIKGNLILNCTCGSFCSQECLNDFHHNEKFYPKKKTIIIKKEKRRSNNGV
jgi:hypothetical protein